MVIIIKTKDNVAPELFRTASPQDNPDKITGSFFDQNSFGRNFRPNWVTNNSGNREGGFKHYHGSKDAQMNVLLHLTGTSRFDNLNTWERIAGGTVFYFDHDTDSNLDGNYVITSFGPPRYVQFTDNDKGRIELRMRWEKYNN
jgi:hypothetical protein